MNGYAMELMGAERLRELRHEASGGRRIEMAARQHETASAWRARLRLHVAGRLARLAGASVTAQAWTKRSGQKMSG